MTLDELKKYRIGRNKNIAVLPQDIASVVYRADIEGYQTFSDPGDGDVPYFSIVDSGVWLKMFLAV